MVTSLLAPLALFLGRVVVNSQGLALGNLVERQRDCEWPSWQVDGDNLTVQLVGQDDDVGECLAFLTVTRRLL
jgi:hypothetical protein